MTGVSGVDWERLVQQLQTVDAGEATEVVSFGAMARALESLDAVSGGGGQACVQGGAPAPGGAAGGGEPVAAGGAPGCDAAALAARQTDGVAAWRSSSGARASSLLACLVNLSDSSCQLVVDGLVAGGIGPGASRVLLQALLVPRVGAMLAAASQPLLEALLQIGSLQPQALHQVLLRPLVSSPGLRPCQVQLLLRLLKAPQLPAAGLRLQLLQDVTCSPPSAWGEAHVALLQGLLAAGPPQALPGQAVCALVAALEAASRQPPMACSAKFAQLLLAVATKLCGVLQREQLAALAHAAAGTRTFLSKTLQEKLAAMM